MRKGARPRPSQTPLRFLGAASVLFAASAVAALPPFARMNSADAPPSGLSAEQIVDKTVAARGGIAAWSKIDTIIWVGHLESTRSPVPSLPFRLEQKRPNKSRFEINETSQRSLRVFDGTTGWKMKNGQDGRPDIKRLSTQELKYAGQATGLEGALIDYRTRGTPLHFELEGTEQIDGRRNYRIGFSTSAGERQHVWIDAETYLETRYDRMTLADNGAASNVVMSYSGYREVEGLAIPSLIEISGPAGGKPDRMIIERLALNPPIDDRDFAGLGDPRGSAAPDSAIPLK